MNQFTDVDILRTLLAKEPAAAAELRRGLGVSQPSLSRLMSRLGSAVQTFGRARSTRYALKRDVRGLGSEFPLYRVGASGTATYIGKLIAVEPRGSVVEYEDTTRAADHCIELPFWLEDARPSGFLGRLIAKRLPEYGYPENVAHWSNDDTLHYWATHGVDLIGDIIVGSHAFQLWSKQKSSSHSREIATYEKHAIEVLALGAAGSSAGGEQPKFLITVENTPALVKFSPPVTTEIGRRRAELLVCEHLALKTLARHNISAAESSIHLGENRVFLELRRFDRTEQGGRKSILSLRALDNEYTGRFPGTWKEIGYALREKQKLSREIYTSILTLHYFGLLIGNDDMHSGNLSFFCDTPRIPDLPTSLAPVYDMLPMCAAPVNESVLPLHAEFPVLDPQDQQIYSGAATIAQEFWREVEAHDWLSREWKPFAVSWVRFIESVVSRR